VVARGRGGARLRRAVGGQQRRARADLRDRDRALPAQPPLDRTLEHEPDRRRGREREQRARVARDPAELAPEQPRERRPAARVERDLE
jgi:hypothetical protein